MTPTASSAQPELQATLNGERLHFATALAVGRPKGRVQVVVSSRPIDCAALDVEPAGDELRFELTLVTKLLPTGRAGWRVEAFEFENTGGSTNVGASIDAAIDPRIGQRSRLAVEEAGAARRLHSHDETRVLVLTGVIEAVGCGDRGGINPRHDVQPGFLEVAGHALPIVDAVLADGVGLNRPGRRLFVSSAPLACSTSTASEDPPWVTVISPQAELLFELQLDDDQPPVAVLDGDWIGEPGGTFRGPAGDLRGTPMTLAGAPTVELTLGGAATLPSATHGALAVALRGTVTARACRVEP